MNHRVLSHIPIIGKFVDERFLEHRRRSTSLGGIAAALVGIALFEYHYFHDHFISWDLLVVLFTLVIVKLSLMFCYRFNG